MAKYEAGFIGVGNMGSALAAAVCRRCPPERVILSNRTPEKAAALAERLGCAAGSGEEAARESRFLLLGVKPQGMGELLGGLAPVLSGRDGRFVLVSMAAGLTTGQIDRMAGGGYPVIRIMPNVPVGVGEGLVLYAANGRVESWELAGFTALLEGAGRLEELPEELMDAGSALAGCGPAFLCQFAEALADGAVACGLPRDKALRCAAQTMLGTAALLLEGEHPAALKDRVCSPGGSTVAGCAALECHGGRAAAMAAVRAAFERTKELGDVPVRENI